MQDEVQPDAENLGFVMRSLDGEAKIATYNNFARGFLPGDIKLSVLNHTVCLGCVVDSSFGEDKTQRFLEDMRNEFSKMY